MNANSAKVMKSIVRLTSVVAAITLAFAGCRSVQEHRVAQRRDYFAQLPIERQERLLAGEVRIGDTPEEVYIALGTPNYVTTDEIGAWVWVYWGTRAEPQSTSPLGIPRFHTRSERRFPARGEKREELRLFFDADRLSDWNLGEIDMAAAGSAQSLKMGTIPKKSG